MLLLKLLSIKLKSSHRNFASEIMDPDYIPTFRHILWAKSSTSGLCESRYILDGTLYRFFDVSGTRHERCKWSPAFRSADSIVFTLDVSDYDQAYAEDPTINRMSEQLKFWDELVQSTWFWGGTNLVVLFTKLDRITPLKLEASPFKLFFPDYSGKPESLEDILQYLSWRLHTASKVEEWKTRRLVLCNPGSIWDSPENMGEITVSALSEVERFQDCTGGVGFF